MSIVMTIVFPLRIVIVSVKHIVAAAQSWNGKEREVTESQITKRRGLDHDR